MSCYSLEELAEIARKLRMRRKFYSSEREKLLIPYKDEIEISIVKISGKKPKCKVTIPKNALEMLEWKGGEKVRVKVDIKKKRLIYELIT